MRVVSVGMKVLGVALLWLGAWLAGGGAINAAEPAAEAASSGNPAAEAASSDKAAAGDSGGEAKAAAAVPEGGKESMKAEPPLAVVSLSLAGDLSESVAPAGLFEELQRSLRQTTEILDRAARDEQVTAVVLRIRELAVGRGRVHELRQAIRRFQRSGKKVYADLQFAMPADYLVASACDELVMPESGTLLLPGVRVEVTFYKNLFERLGVKADMLQVGDFKGAAEPYSRTEMSEAFRTQYGLVVDDFYDQMVDGIATDRRLPRERVEQLIDQGLLTAKDALEAGLVDRVAYESDLRKTLEQAAAPKTLRIVRDYGAKKVDTDFSGMVGIVKLMEMLTGTEAKKRASRAKKIAVVYAVGTISTGASVTDLLGGEVVGGDTLVSALQAAEKDETVAAIVLRIDSPGGSALASDLVWKQVTDCQKPVVASMGDTAASGGYYIAMGCDRIFAEPGTLTGSIGVVGGKLATRGVMDKLGVTTDVISRGRHSGILGSTDAFTDSERERFQAMMKETYDQFTAKAAQGRKMDRERLVGLAGGRVWTGRQAQRHGLVDELGTLDDAIAAARQLASVPAGDETELLILPKPRGVLEQLLGAPESETRSIAWSPWARIWSDSIPGGRDASRALRDAGQAVRLFQEPVLLWMPCQVQIR
jgi:protease-4